VSTSREAAPREATTVWHRGRWEQKFGQPDNVKYFLTDARVLRRGGGGYSFYTRGIIRIDCHNTVDMKNEIYDIG
jgi:hypothetical protein